ncbi:hypothetical protein HKCCE3408_02235 [Rhodobacterales bacterium HKCCE3408]|nr:hypothetical protein [Rhodobacterales bacterium HKCCE3408]
MFGLKKLSRHTALASEMAETLGKDVAGAIERDEAAAYRWRSAVLSCTRCEAPEACAAWLASHERSDAPPSYCRNTATFAGLPTR